MELTFRDCRIVSAAQHNGAGLGFPFAGISDSGGSDGILTSALESDTWMDMVRGAKATFSHTNPFCSARCRFCSQDTHCLRRLIGGLVCSRPRKGTVAGHFRLYAAQAGFHQRSEAFLEDTHLDPFALYARVKFCHPFMSPCSHLCSLLYAVAPPKGEKRGLCR